jgi:hypothetical protein
LKPEETTAPKTKETGMFLSQSANAAKSYFDIPKSYVAYFLGD